MRYVVSTNDDSHVLECTTFQHEKNGWELIIETTYSNGSYIVDPGDEEIEESDEFDVSGFESFELESVSEMESQDFMYGAEEPDESEQENIQTGYQSEGMSFLEERGWTLESQYISIEGGVEIEEYLLDE